MKMLSFMKFVNFTSLKYFYVYDTVLFILYNKDFIIYIFLSLIINQVLRIIQIAVKSDVKTGRI